MRRLLLLLTLFILCTSFVLADGCFAPPASYYNDLFEPEQKAIIVHEEGVETLVLQVKYEGEPTQFGWLIPTPTPATIEEGDYQLFRELHTITKPKHRSTSGIIGRGIFGAGTKSLENGVFVISQGQVGIFEYTTLQATDAAALNNWLNENDYRLPDGATDVLATYVAKDWAYAALRINIYGAYEELFEVAQAHGKTPQYIETLLNDLNLILTEYAYNNTPYEELPLLDYSIEARYGNYSLRRAVNSIRYESALKRYLYSSEGSEKIRSEHEMDQMFSGYISSMKYDIERQLEGPLSTIQLEFATPEAVYPLHISSINAGETEILLYIIDKHKMLVEQAGFELEYASKIAKDSLKGNGYYTPALGKLLEEGEWYVTKHRAKMATSEMTDDVTFTQAENDKAVKETTYSDDYWLIRSAQLAIIVGVYIALLFLFNPARKRKNLTIPEKKVSVTKHAFLTLGCMGIGAIMLLISFVAYSILIMIIDNSLNLYKYDVLETIFHIFLVLIGLGIIWFNYYFLAFIYRGFIHAPKKVKKNEQRNY